MTALPARSARRAPARYGVEVRSSWLVISGVALWLSCGGDPAAADADAGPGEVVASLDAGAVEARDGGEVADAGEAVDGGGQLSDGGEAVDAGEAADAGGEVPDGGEVVDAGPVDAGTDAGVLVVDAGFVDACSTRTAQCPGTPSNLVEGGGLRAIDRCAFPLAPAAGFGGNGALLDALEQRTTPVTVSHVVADANRVATPTTSVPGSPPGLAWAFEWNAEDQSSTTWIPQGITGSADADPSGLVGGKRIILVSFYEDAGLNKGVRIAFVDVTTPSAPRYRFALLVQPTGTVAAPDFVQVDVHAGGLVWFGRWLYVPQTGNGFRVFDLARMMQVATDVDTVGCTASVCRAGLYKYVIPQVGAYVDQSSCGPIFSWVSLDRSSTPPALVSGEYCSTTACSGPLAGRTFRWPLDPTTGLLRGPTTTWPLDAFVMGQRQVQGGARRSGTTYLSSSAPAGGGGALYCLNPTRSLTANFSDSPEDLMVDPVNSQLWSLSEAAGNRAVFAVRFSSYPVP